MKSVLPFIFASMLLFAGGCAQNGPIKVGEQPIDRSLLGKQVVVCGNAQDRKSGICVETYAGDVVYMPDGFKIPGFVRNMRVRISGVLREDHNLPVFIPEPGEQKGGIPVPPGTDLHAASHRWVLTQPKLEK